MNSRLFKGFIEAYREATFPVLRILNIEPSPKGIPKSYIPPRQNLTSRSGCFLSGHRLLIQQVRYSSGNPPRWKTRCNLCVLSEHLVMIPQSPFQQNWCLWLAFLLSPFCPHLLGTTLAMLRPHGLIDACFSGVCCVQQWQMLNAQSCPEAVFRDIILSSFGDLLLLLLLLLLYCFPLRQSPCRV